MLIAPVPSLYFDWSELTISSFAQTTSCDLLLASHEPTLAMPISCSSVRLSSMCQLSVMRPFWILTSDEGDRLALALRLPEPTCEMAGEVHMHSDVVAGDDHLLHRDLKIS